MMGATSMNPTTLSMTLAAVVPSPHSPPDRGRVESDLDMMNCLILETELAEDDPGIVTTMNGRQHAYTVEKEDRNRIENH